MATAKNVKESLLKQLENKGANIDVLKSLIDDYMWFWQQERAMQKDIKKRGRTYMTTSSAGKEYEKNNPSVENAIKYNKQMVAILDALGLDVEKIKGGNKDDPEEDL